MEKDKSERERVDAAMKKTIWEALDDMKNETDRAAIIVGAAIIDDLLRQLLEKTLAPCRPGQDGLLDRDRPLSTFSARISIVHRLGLIDDEAASMLNKLRRLRNELAHGAIKGKPEDTSYVDRVNDLVTPLRNVPSVEDAVAKATTYHGSEISAMCRAAVAIPAGILQALCSQAGRFGPPPLMWRLVEGVFKNR